MKSRRSISGMFIRPCRKPNWHFVDLRDCIWRKAQPPTSVSIFRQNDSRYWDSTRNGYIVEPGDYELLIGAASDDIRLRRL